MNYQIFVPSYARLEQISHPFSHFDVFVHELCNSREKKEMRIDNKWYQKYNMFPFLTNTF